MKASRKLLLLIFWPVVLLSLFAVIVAYWSLSSIKTQSYLTYQKQVQDLHVVQQAADFSQEIGGLHRRVAEAIVQAKLGQLSEVQLYRLHTQIVDGMDALSGQVQALVESELLLEVNHGSVLLLQQEFQSYRRFIIQATDIIAIDPSVAQNYLQQAQESFIQFSMYIQRITYLLAERTEVRSAEEFDVHQRWLYGLILAGIVGLIAVLLLVLLFSSWISRKMAYIADALSQMARSDNCQTILLPNIEQMHAKDSGEFGRMAGALLSFRDAVERRKQAEAEAFELAFYDSLTHLPNRRLLIERLTHALALNHRTKQISALLCFDLDNFKSINDAQGHRAGDQVLVELAERLLEWAQNQNHIARIGGDEFVVVLDALGSDQEQAASKAEQAAEQLRAYLNQPYFIKGERYFSTPSMGIVLFTGKNETIEDLLKQSETAMYNAKSNGRNRISFYDPMMQQVLVERAAMEVALREAIEQSQFELFYQPQVDQAQLVVGAEALIRWHHPERGQVSPGDFIPLAEETGQIKQLGAWVLETACQQLKVWQKNHATAHLTLSVNVSAQQFKEVSFVQQVKQLIDQTQIRPQNLKIELTESTVLESVNEAVEKMRQLRGIGVKFSLDDFGTGYSSLQYLKRLPLDQIKIDQSFVKDINEDVDDAVIVQTIIAMSHALGIEVIAEGVETQAQKHLLERQGCRFYQGYLFGKPCPIKDFHISS
ncbi:putative bifunctional diguanylate cyclase/phosphodiesterase [Thiomicrospira microaerophila]|uniref:putative bifunctional diguanylate cyclase/phosphodiesterase n=1 Tax=Thiomicrospira microaerophila TaxID=406020 RepID=UPI0005C8F0C2|nr:EAL domain-containing protein [Thiomicrospira microaerophila]